MMNMVADDKCTLCNKNMEHTYKPMKEWKIDGTLCGECYSKKLSDFYPGEHTRVDLTGDT
jgi:hypothetical protein|tara:strand:+ start:543 stop:722 length:180 start_codon:yes stop_codon:yes gene_type:complete